MSSDLNHSAMRQTVHGPTMGTRWSVTLDVESATQGALLQRELAAAVAQVDAQMSPWKADSDLMRFNRAPVGTWVELSAEIVVVLARALEIAHLSGGAFDPALGALVDAWGFGSAREQPDPAAIRDARNRLPAAAYTQIELDRGRGRARRHAQIQLDLCGIAKGYGVDRMVEVLQQHGVANALAALDGELRALGSDGNHRPWAIALERPETKRRTVHGVIELEDLAIATSGDYRRFWQIEQTRLAHTMDPHRAAPVHNAVASVTVLARTCMDADAWATALLVAGAEAGPALASRVGLEALWLLRHDDDLVELGRGRFASDAHQPERPERSERH